MDDFLISNESPAYIILLIHDVTSDQFRFLSGEISHTAKSQKVNFNDGINRYAVIFHKKYFGYITFG